MKLPYGISNFAKLVTQGYEYIDKTPYLERLETLNDSYIFFLRPRRFGKSLFVSMMMYYYDIHSKAQFDSLFSKYYIGKKPTDKVNSYHILFFEFSGIDTETKKSTLKGFLQRVKDSVEEFLRKYSFSPEHIDRVLSMDAPNLVMTEFFKIVKANRKIYIMIDEYDHFANKIMAANPLYFSDLISGTGFVRVFYETIKTASFAGIVDRMFVTGVTPITLDSLTSGFNIASNLSTKKELNEIMGFNQEEVQSIIHKTIKDCDIDRNKVLEDVKNWYNGYSFSQQAKQRIYNPDMILYFAKEFDQTDCSYPEQLIDVNIASDYGRIARLFNIKDRSSNYEVLNSLIQNGDLTAQFTYQFSFEKEFGKSDFISLLFYMGFISIKSSQGSRLRFQIPNYVIHKLYYDFFLDRIKKLASAKIDYEKIEDAVYDLAYENRIHSMIGLIEEILTSLSNRDFIHFDEKYIKVLFVALINLSGLYYVKSEMEIHKLYPDILLLYRNPFKPNYQFIFELKYLKKTEAEKLDQVTSAGLKQLDTYLALTEINNLENLKAYLIIFIGDQAKVYEKKTGV